MHTLTETYFTGSHDSSPLTEGKRFIAALSILTILYQSILSVPLVYAQSGTVFESTAASSSEAEVTTSGSGSTISSKGSSSISSEATQSSDASSSEEAAESSSAGISSTPEASSESTSSITSESSSSAAESPSSVSSESEQSSSIAVTLTGNTILDVPENTHPTFEIKKTAEIQSSEELEARITVIVTDPTGETSEALVAVTENLGEYLLTLEPPPNFKPGKYHVEARLNETRGIGRRVQRLFRIAFTGDSGDTILFEQDFTWGVVAFNPDRSVYLPGESGAFSLAVLDDKGHTLCDSSITMKVTKPDGKIQTFTTKDKSIYINPDCRDKEVTYVPDYSFNFEFNDIGIYSFEMSATTKNGVRTLSQDIETTDDRLIDVKRFSATRIYPLANYDMKLKVTPSKTFIGNITEVVPATITIVDVTPTPKDIVTNEKTGEKTIVWGEKLWEAGETYEMQYTYDAPDVSPEFYLVGPLSANGTLTEPLTESVNVTDISSSAESSSESSDSSSEDSSQASSAESSISSESSEASSSEDSSDSSESSVSSEEISSSSESSSSSEVSSESASSIDSSETSSSTTDIEAESSSSTSWIQKTLAILFPYIHAQSLIEDTLAFEEPRQWQIASDATGLSITGRFRGNDGINTNASYNVAVSLNGGAVAASDTTDAGGEFVITNLTMTAGTIVSLFGNGSPEKAITVTLGSGSSMTGIDLIQNRLTVRSDSGTTALTVQHLNVADNSGDAEFARIYTIDSGILNVKVGKGLTIARGTFRPGAEMRVGSGMTINGRFEWENNPVLLSGSWLTGSQGSFTGTNIVSFNGRFTNGLTQRRYIATNGYSFSGVTLSQPTGGIYTFTGTTLRIHGDLRVTVGNTFTGFDNSLAHTNVYINGSFIWNAASGRLNPGNGTWYIGKHLLLPVSPTMTLGTSKYVITGSGVLVRSSTTTRPLRHISFSGSAAFWAPGGGQVGIAGEFIVGTGATITLSGATSIRPFSGTPNFTFHSNSRLYGALQANQLQLAGSSSIKLQNGIIDIGLIWVYGSHNSTGSGYIAPARYDSPVLIEPQFETNARFRPASGTYRFMENVTVNSNSSRFVIDDRDSNPRLVFEKDLVVYSTGASTNLAWYKGDNSLVFSGSNIQNAYFGASRIYEDIEINKDAGKAVRLTGTGMAGLITDGINLRRGELELLGRPLAVSGSITISGGSFKAGSGAVRLSGSLLNTGGWFAASTGSMVLDGGNQTLSGSNTFNTLTKIVTAARTLTLAGTKTQTISGALVLRGAAGALLSLRSTTDGIRSNLKLVTAATQTIDYLDVKDNDGSQGLSLTCFVYSEGCVDSGNNRNWNLGQVVAGRVFTDEGVTSIGAGKIVSMSVNGGANTDSTLTDAGGMFTLSGAFLTGGTIVTLFLDGNTEKGVLVTSGSGGAMTGMNIYQNRLIVRSDSGSVATTNAFLRLAQNSNSSDTDISAVYTVDSNVLNVKSGKALTVWTGDSFTPGAAVNVGSGITINGAFTMGANNVALSGAWIAKDAGSFTGTNIVTFNGVWATTGHKRLIRSNGSSFSGMTIDTTGGTWALSGALALAGNFSTTTRATSSTVFDNTVHNSGPNAIRGTFTWAGLGTFRPGGHTWTFQNNISFASNISSLVSTNNPQLVMAGTGRVLQCPSSSKPLIHFVFSGSTRLAATNGQCTVGRKFTVGSGATITLTDGETLGTNTTAANVQLLGSNSRITGGAATMLSITSTGSIRIQRGVISTDIMYVSGVHNPVPAGTGMIAAGRYLSNRIEFAPGTSIAFATGTTTFGGDVFFNHGTSTYFNVRNNVYNPTLVFKKNVSLSQNAGATITWEKGTGTIHLSGSTTQNVYLNGKAVEDIVIDKTAAVRLTGTGTTGGATDSLTIRNGSLEQLGQTLAISGDVTMQNGTTFKQGSGALRLSGSLLNSNGWFGASTGTTTLNGTNQTLSGSNSFYNLTKIVTASRTLTLAGTKTQTVTGALVLTGASGQRLSLRSTTTGVQANLKLVSGGSQTLTYLDVKDNNASGVQLNCETSCESSGNTTNWKFGSAGTGSIAGKVWIDTDGDGTRDAGENSGLSGVTLTLAGNSASGQSIALTRYSNSLGNYGFSGVVLSNSAGYTVAIDLSSVTGYIRTQRTSSGGNLLSTGSTIRLDFGFVQASTLTGSVFIDTDADSVKDSGETTVFSGASLTLTGTTGTGGSLSRTVLSNASGTYTFSNLPTGSGNFLLVITPPSGYDTTATDSRSVTIATGGQTKNEHFGYVAEPVSSSSSSSAGTAGTSGGARQETIEIKIREATEEEAAIPEEPTPVTRPLTPEEIDAQQARELARNERERRDDRMRKLSRLLRIDEEKNTYLSRVEERKRERLRELALVEQLKPKPLISLKPIPQSPATDLLDAVKDSYLKKVMESAKRVTAFFGKKLLERAKDMQSTVAVTRERLAHVINRTQDNVFSLAVLLTDNFTDGTASLIAQINEFRNAQSERFARVMNRTLDDVSMLAGLLTDDLIDGTASLIAQIGELRDAQRAQQKYARTIAISTLVGSIKPIGDGATTLALTIGAALTNGMMNTGEVGKTFALALITAKDSVDSLGNLVAFRTSQFTNFTEREIESALAWTEKSTDRILALTLDIANDRIIGNIRSTLALREEIAHRREETSQVVLTFTREGIATFTRGGQVALEQSGESSEKILTLTRNIANDTIIGNIRSTLELRDEIAHRREETAGAALAFVRGGVATFKRGAEIAAEQSSRRLSQIGNVSDGARQSAVLALAKMLGVSDRIKHIDDSQVPIADIPMEYKTKIRMENGKTVLAAFHMNITNTFGDPYRNTPVVLFSTPKVAVTNDQGIVTFHSVEVGMHHVEIHSGGNVERREVIIEPPADLLAFDSKPTDVVLPVVQIVVSQPQHGAAPDKTTVPPLALALIALLVLGNIYTFYPVIRMYRRRRLGK